MPSLPESPEQFKALPSQPWHAEPLERVYPALQGGPEGLDDPEAQERLKHFGPNRLPEAPRPHPLRRFLAQFKSVLILVLLVAGIITAILGEWIETSVIMGVVLINAVIGFVQEGKAEEAMLALRDMLSPQARVQRGGRILNLPAEQLVPGDLVLLQAGDRVPADLRLVEARDLQINEAPLTGESLPVLKQADTLAMELPLAERRNMAFAATLATRGVGKGIVIATGLQSEIGRISGMLARVQVPRTPLLKQMDHFSRVLSAGILAISLAILLFGWSVHGQDPRELFMAVIGLAVAAIPEGLPAVITIILAIGVQRMARRQAIIRQLPAIETLGAVSVICTDKTGTLTQNAMRVEEIVLGREELLLAELRDEEAQLLVRRSPALAELLLAGILCNDAEAAPANEGWTLEGDPTETALLELAIDLGLDPQGLRAASPRLDLLPFESDRQLMITLNQSSHGNQLFLKGAPERVMDLVEAQGFSGSQETLDRAFWQAQVMSLASRGYRILALATRAAEIGQGHIDGQDPGKGWILLGLVGMEDPPRMEAGPAVARCQAAGIRVKMITGDHAVTARAIGARLGIGDGEKVLEGNALEVLDDRALAEQVRRVDVFARISPEQKLRLVEALQAQGAVVAMTGDGVNDAAALRRANVGIAMGRKGTDAAREAAEMVLADDNFATISHAVEEGRGVYDNIQKTLLYILPTNAGEALILVLAILLGMQLPITPVQVLWVNMITSVTLGLALAFEPVEPGVMQRPPRNPNASLLSGSMLFRILYIGLLLVAGTAAIFYWLLRSGAGLDYARTAAVNTLVLFEIFYLLPVRALHGSVWQGHVLKGNPWSWGLIGLVLVLQGLFTYWPPMQALFSTAALRPLDWLWMTLLASSVFWLVELEKFLFGPRKHI